MLCSIDDWETFIPIVQKLECWKEAFFKGHDSTENIVLIVDCATKLKVVILILR